MFSQLIKKADASQIFLVDFAFFLDYCWKAVNILIYLPKCYEIMTWTIEKKIICVKINHVKKKPFISVQVRYRRKFDQFQHFLPSEPSTTVKTIRKNIYALLNLHITVTSTVDIWSMDSRAPLEITHLGFRLHVCKYKNSIYYRFYMCN